MSRAIRWSALCLGLLLTLVGCVAAGGSGTAGVERGDTSGGRPTVDTGTADLGATDTDSEDLADTGTLDTEPQDTTDAVEPVDTEPVDTEPPIDDNCEQLSAVAERQFAPVDIIWAIDTSGSMGEEAAILQSQLNAFVSYFESVSLDYRVVLIGDAEPGGGSIDVCVPPPLSGGGCPEADGPRYRRVREWVDSWNSLEVIDSNWDSFADFLRPDAIKHIIVVSDDESSQSAAWFRRRMEARLPGGVKFHSIVSLTEREDCFLFICDTIGCSGPNGDAEARGSTYITLSNDTGGIAASICDAEWTPIFEQIAEGVVRGAGLACSYEIPAAPFGEIVYESVRVEYIPPDGSSRAPLTRVDGAASCTGAGEWYYDNNTAPTHVELCPAACGDLDGSVEIFFDCIKV